MGRRGRGEGTIYYSKARKKWVVQLSPGPDGRRPLRTADSEAEALRLKRQMEAERAAGRDLSHKAETVKELLDDYIEAIADQVRDTTMLSYRLQVDYVGDLVGKSRIDALTVEGVQRLANAITRDHGAVTAKLCLMRLHTAYERVIPERVSRNPVDWKRLTLKRTTPAERRPLEDAQVRAHLVAADDVENRGVGARYAVAWWIAALLGMRRGEICGASWRDLSWERAELHVRQQYAKKLDGSYALGQIKTAAGVRVLPLGPRLLARLRAHWELQQAERRLLGANWKEHGLILTHEDGTPVAPYYLNQVFARQCAQLKSTYVHPHLLRHTLASAISEEGYSEAVIAAVLGHDKGANVTRRYTHASERIKRRAVEAVEARILGAAAEGKKDTL
jgi:integrase